MTETKKTTKATKKVEPQTIDRLSGNEVFKYTDKNGYEYEFLRNPGGVQSKVAPIIEDGFENERFISIYK